MKCKKCKIHTGNSLETSDFDFRVLRNTTQSKLIRKINFLVLVKEAVQRRVQFELGTEFRKDLAKSLILGSKNGGSVLRVSSL